MKNILSKIIFSLLLLFPLVISSRGFSSTAVNITNLGGSSADTTFTMTVTATTTAPTKSSSITTDLAVWHREGRYMVITYTYQGGSGGSAGNGIYLFALPAGFSIDTTNFKVTSTFDLPMAATYAGSGKMSNTATVNVSSVHDLALYAYDTTHLRAVYGFGDSSNFYGFNWQSGSAPNFSSNPMYLSFTAKVPISGW